MNKRMLALSLLSIVMICAVSSGCAKYATTGRMIGKIENRVEIGASEEEFKEKMPYSSLAHEEEGRKIYLLVVQEPCFICGTGKAFLRSYETYVNNFVFEDGKLISIDRIESGL